jgi:hypothetical protein
LLLTVRWRGGSLDRRCTRLSVGVGFSIF